MTKSLQMNVFPLRNKAYQKFVCSKTSGKQIVISTKVRSLHFVPLSEEPTAKDVSRLEEFIAKSKKLFVLTGAGISTESGIPDYRSEGVGLYATSKNRPVQYVDFLKSAEIRQRYWARNYVGWPRFSSFEPNAAHRTLSNWETLGKIQWLVTQNVDALHYKAGSLRVTELHGSAHRVVCLNCKHKILRSAMQEQIKALNPEWHAHSLVIVPDGDVVLSSEQVRGFKVPECLKCGGTLKPEIIFFGDNVPKPTVNFVFNRLTESDTMLVVGSSLEVYSGFRFASRAHAQDKPIAIINIGKTRADHLATLKISARCGQVLKQVHVTS